MTLYVSKSVVRLLLILAFFAPRQWGGTQGAQPAEPWFSVAISTPRPVVAIGADVKLKIIFTSKAGEDIRYGRAALEEAGPFLI